MEDYLNQIKIQRIAAWGTDIDEEKLAEMINRKIRVEKVAIKDASVAHRHTAYFQQVVGSCGEECRVDVVVSGDMLLRQDRGAGCDAAHQWQ